MPTEGDQTYNIEITEIQTGRIAPGTLQGFVTLNGIGITSSFISRKRDALSSTLEYIIKNELFSAMQRYIYGRESLILNNTGYSIPVGSVVYKEIAFSKRACVRRVSTGELCVVSTCDLVDTVSLNNEDVPQPPVPLGWTVPESIAEAVRDFSEAARTAYDSISIGGSWSHESRAITARVRPVYNNEANSRTLELDI